MSQGITTHVPHLGAIATFRALCERYGLPYKTLWRRYSYGDRDERLIRPVDQRFAHRGNWHEIVPARTHQKAEPAGARVSEA